MWHLKKGQTVGERGDIANSEPFRLPIMRDRIGLHYYVAKSRQEYEEKHRSNETEGRSVLGWVGNKYIWKTVLRWRNMIHSGYMYMYSL